MPLTMLMAAKLRARAPPQILSNRPWRKILIKTTYSATNSKILGLTYQFLCFFRTIPFPILGSQSPHLDKNCDCDRCVRPNGLARNPASLTPRSDGYPCIQEVSNSRTQAGHLTSFLLMIGDCCPMRYRDFSRVALILGRSSDRILPLNFQNHGGQDAALDEILNGCIVDRNEFLRALPLDGDQGFCPELASFEGFSRLVCQVFCQQDAPIDEILFEDTLESVFEWRPSRIPRNKYLGSLNKATG
jgi:hypothetical protein